MEDLIDSRTIYPDEHTWLVHTLRQAVYDLKWLEQRVMLLEQQPKRSVGAAAGAAYVICDASKLETVHGVVRANSAEDAMELAKMKGVIADSSGAIAIEQSVHTEKTKGVRE